MRKISYFFVIIVVLFTNGTVRGQTPPPEVETGHRDALWDYYKVERQIEQNRQFQPSGAQLGTPQPPPADLDGKSTEKIFELKEVRFKNQPKTIKAEELKEIAARYTSQERVSIRDLYDMLGEIDKLFDKRHVIGRAILPVQDVNEGIVEVQIIEGRVGKKDVQVNRQPYTVLEGEEEPLIPIGRLLGSNFVNHQLNFPRGRVLNTKELEEELLSFNRKFRSQLLVELEPGNDQGESDMNLTLVAPQPVSAGYYCDSSGRETSGRIRNGAFIQLQSLTGLDESFFCSYDKTKGTSYLTMYGDIPVTAFGTWFEMSYDDGTPKTISGPFADLNITGMSRRYRPGLRQLLWNTEKRKGEFTFAVESYESDSRFDGVVNYSENLTGYSFGLSNVYRHDKILRVASVTYNFGKAHTGGNPYANLDTKRTDYHLLQASGTQVWYPNSKWTWLFRATGQIAMSELPQSRVFQIGGMATVRGVNESLMSAESGYFLSLEGRRLLTTFCNRGRLEAFGFIDHGGIAYRDYDANTTRPADYIISIGGGLMFTWNRYLSATLGAGEPIFRKESHQETFKNDLKHGQGYFSVRVQF